MNLIFWFSDSNFQVVILIFRGSDWTHQNFELSGGLVYEFVILIYENSNNDQFLTICKDNTVLSPAGSLSSKAMTTQLEMMVMIMVHSKTYYIKY